MGTEFFPYNFPAVRSAIICQKHVASKMPAADLANYADVDLSKITTDEKLGLPNYMLASLIIRQECKAKGHIIRPKSFTITGHVDSGKSTVTALCLTAMGIVDMKKVEALEA